jgi:glycosyltransferase involved in cell wall biosynthesis
MKRGLEHFVYRELTTFAGQGAEIRLFPTKFGVGLYNAPESWRVQRWSILAVLLAQPLRFLSNPLLYVRLLLEAAQTGAYVDFLLAWYFSPEMAQCDVIYATFGDHKLFVGYFGKRITGKPLAVTIHAYELYQNPNPELFERALALCDQVITVTEYNRELLREQYGVNAEVVRISVDVADYQPQDDKFVILIVAFFAERKGHEILFRAIKQLGLPDVEVWVVGDAGAEDKAVDVRRLAKEIGVDNQVAFFGKLSGNALKAVYRESDVFCLPCHTDSDGVNEGFPTVIAEAMAFGKPVISTHHVEIPRVLTDVLVAEKDVAGLADAILKVKSDAEGRKQMGENNRRLSERMFSTHNAERTAQILSRLAQKSAGGSFELQGETS